MKNLFIVLILLVCKFTPLSIEATQQRVESKPKIGLCIMATGKYSTYAQKLIKSGRKFFLKGYNVTYFVFTDQNMPKARDTVTTYQKRLGWPYDTLKRFYVYYENKNLFKNMDYLFALDADMRFVAPVGKEILGDLVGTLHPCFVGGTGTYEKNPLSSAYIRDGEGLAYYCGGFYGGSKREFLQLLEQMISQIDADFQRNHIAVWHDESHLNRYFIDHPPTLTLTPSYCYPEGASLPYKQKILALNKNHEEMRK